MTRVLIRLAAGIFSLALLFFPQAGAQGARSGLVLCAQTLIPSLFPAFAAAGLAMELGLGRWLGRKLGPVMEPVFHLSGPCALPLALGLLGGYPVGAQSLGQLRAQGLCSREEEERLLLFCNNSGPAFLLGVLGGSVFGQPSLGLFLWLVHALSAFGVGLLTRGERRPHPSRALPNAPLPSPAAAFSRAVKQALASVLQVSAYVVLFQVLLGLIQALPLPQLPFSRSCQALLMGMLELTGGVCALTEELSLAGRLALASFLMGWGGLAVHCQTMALLEEEGLSFSPYLQAKLLQGLLAAGICLVLLALFPSLIGAPSLSLSPLPLAGAGLAVCLGLVWTRRGKKDGNPDWSAL